MSELTGIWIDEAVEIPKISADFASGADSTVYFSRKGDIFKILAAAPEIKRPAEPIRAACDANNAADEYFALTGEPMECLT